MIKKIVVAVLFFSFFTSTFVEARENENPDNLPGLRVGMKAPDFELKNLSGERVKLSDYMGKKVIVNFWATWCPPCKAEIPDLQRYYTEAGDEVQILAVNIDPQNDVKKFVADTKVTFPVLLDDKDSVNRLYKILSIPTTYFIDEEGIVRNKYLSVISIEKIREYVDHM